ncbi:hypothetical protein METBISCDRAFT_21492 [Metschnikowia bicuspidata]|uniref:1,3-beta-glucanosyltransferase n=1 Tax=Metschnikowia bicuspidata TaxID=27322 RepID=A0A4P9ZK58_9ASCO|nr:hypothetical protein METBISCDRAFT_21492 [Metschnikowia bicuspidata]
MNAFADVGIYVIADLSDPGTSINSASPEWTLQQRVGFFAGNEVTNEVSNTGASAYIKAAIRDVKAHIKARNYIKIPVGYSANDDINIRLPLAEYFACGDEADRANFFGMIMYECWVISTFEQSGYARITEEYTNLGIGLFFSKYGCNEVTRDFQETEAIYGPEMVDLWSGGQKIRFDDSDGAVSTLPDFDKLKGRLALITPTLVPVDTAATPTVTTCPSIGSNWMFHTSLPPTPDARECDCMESSLSCVLASGLSPKNYGDLFGYICGVIDCSDIGGTPTPASTQKLNYLLDLYYHSHNMNPGACDFGGSATLRTPSVAPDCSSYITSAIQPEMSSVSSVVSSNVVPSSAVSSSVAPGNLAPSISVPSSSLPSSLASSVPSIMPANSSNSPADGSADSLTNGSNGSNSSANPADCPDFANSSANSPAIGSNGFNGSKGPAYSPAKGPKMAGPSSSSSIPLIQ